MDRFLIEPLQINADRTAPALMHAGRLPWLPSPRPGVDRRMLERMGGEVALATSIVRYAAGSRFNPHTHGLGEEFLVLQGTFADEHGHYLAGTYVRNPPGSGHAPYSPEGCVIFVKLRQMLPQQQRRVVLGPAQMEWSTTQDPLRCQALLHADAHETVHLEQLGPGCTIPARQVMDGEEILVVDGAVRVDGQALEPWSWLRQPGSIQPALHSEVGALLWIKRGHLPA